MVAAELETAKRKVETAVTDFDKETIKVTESARANGMKKAAEIESEGQRKQAGKLREAAEVTAQTTLIQGGAQAKVAELLNRAEASRTELMVKAYGSPQAYNLASFAEKLPSDVKIEYRYAGPGTFWTDSKQNLTEVAAKRILAQTQPSR